MAMAWTSFSEETLLSKALSNLYVEPSENSSEASEGERIQNCQNEEKSLDVAHYVSRIKDKINVVIEMKPIEPPVRRYGPVCTEPPKIIPMRMVCVVDVSHSMAESYGPDDGVPKLEKVKIFMQLLIKSLHCEDYLSIVTFGTTSRVVFPLLRMSPANKEEAAGALESIAVGGVTNMGAGIFSAIDQFNTNFAKSRYFDDNIVLFTDGMANEGITETEDMLKEVRRKIHALKEECHFEKDYTIKLCTLGTTGFLPEMLFYVGQEFSSDAFFFLDEDANLELNLMKPVLMRQNSIVSSVRVRVEAMHGVSLDRSSMSQEYVQRDHEGVLLWNEVIANYLIHDICAGMERHIVCGLKLPNKHKKSLKAKDVLKITVTHRNSTMEVRSVEFLLPYEDIPKKDIRNREPDVLVSACHECRLTAQKTLDKTAAYIMKLNRARAKETLQDGVNNIREYLEMVSAMLSHEESHSQLLGYVDPILNNLENCENFVTDFTVRWDDAWGRLKALSSSIAREVPTSSGVYVEGAELFTCHKVEDKTSDLSQRLRDIYASLGLESATLDKYFGVVKELEKKIEANRFNETEV